MSMLLRFAIFYSQVSGEITIMWLVKEKQFKSIDSEVDFLALDVETANPSLASICQIGVAGFLGGRVVCEGSLLVNPEDWFDPYNVDIHGIQEEHVVDAPSFGLLSSSLNDLLEGKTCVIHTHFDRSAITQACVKHESLPPQCYWLDSAMVARRTWDSVSKSGYGLANLTKMLGIEFRHHDALEDAKAAGQIMFAAIQESGIPVSDWLGRVKNPIYPSHVKHEGNPDGPLFGEVLVFTGELTIPRGQAAQIAADLGCAVKSGVSKNISVLVVGDQDITRLAGHNRSSKHRKALELKAQGHAVRIIQEADFLAMLEST